MELHFDHGAAAVAVDRKHPAMRAGLEALSEAFDSKAVLSGIGASIPVVKLFTDLYHVPVVLMGVGNVDSAIHSPNENLKLDHYYRGIEASVLFLQKYSAL